MFAVATPLYGRLQVHVEDCPHLPRLYAGGGGVLSNGFATRERAMEVARQDDERAKYAPCARKPKGGA